MTVNLEAHYRRYIDRLNQHAVDDLSEFVHDTLIYNGQTMTRSDYEASRAGEIATIPDLYFDIDLLVVQDDLVACRIKFQCTPEDTFLGLAPNGKTISFCEHVFYRFRDGKICEVWSLVDQQAIREQLAS